jgi:hypothetical protein
MGPKPPGIGKFGVGAIYIAFEAIGGGKPGVRPR